MGFDFYEAIIRGTAACYFFAFYSIYSQWPVLFGVQGLQPVSSWFHPDSYSMASNVTSSFMIKDFIACFTNVPTLGCICNSYYLDFSLDFFFEFCALTGILVSSLVAAHYPMFQKKFTLTLALTICWICYLSLYSVGKVFLSFQWDALLLETGFAAIVSSVDAFSNSGLYIYRIILFKLMFMSGIVKLQSNGPTWWNLTALNYHFATQCIPTPLAWYAHQLPNWVKRIGVAFTLLVEGPFTLFIFSPFSSHRKLYFRCLCVLMFAIFMTGNYNFFNILTIILGLSLLEGDDLKANYQFDFIIRMVGKLYMAITSFYYFDLVFQGREVPVRLRQFGLNYHINFSLKVVFCMHIVYIWYFSCKRISQVFRSLVLELKERDFAKMLSLGTKLIFGAIFFVLLFVYISLLLSPLLSLDEGLLQGVNEWISTHSSFSFFGVYLALNKLAISNQYGLFRRMTGVLDNDDIYPAVVGRPEIFFKALLLKNETSQESYEGSWVELHFPYKPSISENDALSWVAPLQPRVDWQLWFASLQDYQRSPWVIHMVDKLLQGSKNVIGLLSHETQEMLINLKEDGYTMQAVSAVRKYIDFTRIKSKRLLTNIEVKYFDSQPKSYNTQHVWYDVYINGTRLEEEYMPVLEKDNDSVLHFLKHHNWDRYLENDAFIRKARSCGSFDRLCSVLVTARSGISYFVLQFIISWYFIRYNFLYSIAASFIHRARKVLYRFL